jgi:prepilin-type N-terminal cleavage/methylation domain-containing protein
MRVLRALSDRVTPRGRRGLRARVGARAFTLIELMVVILIITVFASVALPTAVLQLRERRLQEAARQVALLFRQARLHAVGRGTATLVRITGGEVSLFEAREGPTATCPDMPIPQCQGTPWASGLTLRRDIGGFKPAASGELSTLDLSVKDSGGTTVSELEICFSPNGRGFVREAIDDGVPFTPLTETYLATLTRPGASRPRNVALLPNGTARLRGR